jgi:serine/threonine protein kinase
MAMEAGTVPFRDSDKLLFLASEPQWSQRLGEGWKGIRFLGRGAFGVVGLWEYQGDPTAPSAPKITKVVVKMSCDEPMDQANLVFGTKSPFEEGWMLEQLAKAGSPHIIRQYGGNKIGDRFGDMDKVVRIFLEYCRGGDLDQFVGPVGGKAEEPLSEVDLWTIFRCLAKGVAVLDRGTENPNEQAWDAPYPEFPEICHYDIKPDNSKHCDHVPIFEALTRCIVLLGNRDRIHKRLPVAKVWKPGLSGM